MRYYTGVGSRRTPKRVLQSMTRIARALSEAGYTLRSGAAEGADTAFEAGSQRSDIYLPWPRFRDHPSPLTHVSNAALAWAAKVHPAWHLLNKHARLLHGRNAYQVLGQNLDTKSEFVICYTPDGRASGGTGTAIRLATSLGIPVYNLHAWNEQKILEAVK